MPSIHVLFGIVISMNFVDGEHNPPHVHARYGDYNATYNIKTGKLIDGYMPLKQNKHMKGFLSTYKETLLEMWETQDIHKI